MLRCLSLLSGLVLLAGMLIAAMLPAAFQLNAAPVDHGEEMLAVAYEEHGGSSVLTLGSWPKPGLLPNQILVEVHFASLNPCDFKFRRDTKAPRFVQDFLFPKPKITSEDLAGVVVERGAAVSKFNIGDRVAAMLPIMHTRWGALAQFAAVDEDHAALVPDELPLNEAAAMPLVALTVVQSFAKLGNRTMNGRSLLVQAGAGGVGSFAVQYASVVLGMDVVATASAKNADFLRDIGAARTIDYRKESFDHGEPGFDVVLDPLSYEYEGRTIKPGVLAENGAYLNLLSSDWALDVAGTERANGFTTALNALYFGAASLLLALGLPSFDSRSYHLVFVNPSGADLRGVLNHMDPAVPGGPRIRAIIDSTYALKDVARAYDYLEEGHARGKVLIEITRDG